LRTTGGEKETVHYAINFSANVYFVRHGCRGWSAIQTLGVNRTHLGVATRDAIHGPRDLLGHAREIVSWRFDYCFEPLLGARLQSDQRGLDSAAIQRLVAGGRILRPQAGGT
jgi:hypothetical protein